MAIYLNGVNLSFGQKGESGKSAYACAQEQGYSGTESEFGQELANAVETQMLFGRFNSQITWNEDETVYTESWEYNGDNYQQILTMVSDTEFTAQLLINETNAGLWTTLIDETTRVSSTTYITE